MIDPTSSTARRDIFYSGISLKEYLRKSAILPTRRHFKPDETILVDEHHLPVIIDDSFIQV